MRNPSLEQPSFEEVRTGSLVRTESALLGWSLYVGRSRSKSFPGSSAFSTY